MSNLSRKKKVLFSLVACCLVVVLLEGILRVRRLLRPVPKGKTSAVRNQAGYFVPHHFLNYAPNPEHPNHNSMGFRGREIALEKPEGVRRIVCLGGSSTYGTRVSEEGAFPHLLEQALNESGPDKYEVINAGVPGYTSANVFILFQFRILPLSPDMIIVYCGYNDVYPRLMGVDSYDYSGFNMAWERVPFAKRVLFSSLLVEKVVGNRGYRWNMTFLKWPPHLHEITRVPEASRVENPKADLNAEFEHTTAAVFERNITSLVQLAKANGVETVLLTQALFESKATDHPLFAKGVEEHNNVLRRIANDRNAMLVDLAKLLPKNADYFADSIHMSKKGNAARAQKIADFLRDGNLPAR